MNIFAVLRRQLQARFGHARLDLEKAMKARSQLGERSTDNSARGAPSDDVNITEQRSGQWFEQWRQDLSFAGRSLRKNPGFTFVMLVTIALGIGVNTSMFSVLNVLLLRDLPYPNGDRLVRIYRTSPQSQTWPHAPANILDYQAQSRGFVQFAAFARGFYNLAEPDKPVEQLHGLDVGATFFATLGVTPLMGRTFTVEEETPGRNGVMILSHGSWTRRFGADPAIIGRELRVNGEPITIIGVMPPEAADRIVWSSVEAWRPLALSPEARQVRNRNSLGAIARLAPDVSLAQAQVEASAIGRRLAIAYPLENAERDLRVVSLARTGQDPSVQRISWFAMGLAGCVLTIACANLANLQFARNVARSREFAVRAALGASRMRLMRIVLAESLLLSLAGGALGLLVAGWTNDVLGRYLLIAGESGLAIPLDPRVLGFAFTISGMTGVAFGFLPAWLVSRASAGEALKQGSRGTTPGQIQQRLRHALVVAEVAGALVLLSGAAFFIRGLERFAHGNLGWEADQLLTGSIYLPAAKYGSGDARRTFCEQLEAKITTLPGVDSAAVSWSLPFGGFSSNSTFVVEGRDVPAPGNEPLRVINGVGARYFETLGIRFVEGRSFGSAELPDVVIINETMARTFWPGESAVGRRIGSRDPANPSWKEIVGVVRDVRFPARLGEPETFFQTYEPILASVRPGVSIALRCAISPEALADPLRRAVAELDGDMAVVHLMTGREGIADGLANFTVLGWLFVGFALLGVVLAGVGIYGVIAGYTAQRTNEIGLRVALGAQLRDIYRLVVGTGLKLALIGTVLGLAGAIGVGQVLQSIAPSLPPPEAMMVSAVTAFILAVATAASWIPARRATKVDPMTALRSD